MAHVYDHRTQNYREVEEEDDEDTTEDEDGMYYCPECGHDHHYDSNIGEEHLQYKQG